MTDAAFFNRDGEWLRPTPHRDPVGEWLGSESLSHRQPDGVGMSDSLLFDEHGAVGLALQTRAMNA